MLVIFVFPCCALHLVDPVARVDAAKVEGLRAEDDTGDLELVAARGGVRQHLHLQREGGGLGAW